MWWYAKGVTEVARDTLRFGASQFFDALWREWVSKTHGDTEWVMTYDHPRVAERIVGDVMLKVRDGLLDGLSESGDWSQQQRDQARAAIMEYLTGAIVS